jgi:hypothetical protein
MRETLDVLNRMVADRVIGRYAIGGAVATYNYIEATVTDDLDILIAVDAFEERPRSSLVLLTPITQYLAERGYTEWRNEGIVIGGWPVQFLPVSSKPEALDHALDHVIRIGVSDSVETRILRAEHLVAIALKVGRPKDSYSHRSISGSRCRRYGLPLRHPRPARSSITVAGIL